MSTDNFIIILDPEIDEETGELILLVSKINEGKNMEILGAFTGKEAEEVVDLFLGMKDKEDKNND